jgi:hypothetical protein
MSIKIFRCPPKFSVSDCRHYSRYDTYVMYSAHRITPDALYQCYASCPRNSDTFYRELLIRFLINLDIFVTNKTHTFIHAVA